ncbi:MAG: HNH endonuclease [Polyangiaceae bacterium]|nr:HNH endonuclease [Polyangiaceae bacterium]
MNPSPFRALAFLRFIVCACQPFRAFVSWGLIVCMLFSLTPLGCHSVKVRHGMGWPGQPQVPEDTAERLKECGELIQEGIDSVRHPVDAKVVLDENGHVLDVTTAGEPNPDVGMCIRVALRGMKVDKDVIHEAMLRRPPSPWPNSQTMPDRAHIGEVVIVTVVVVVFTEVIIEVVAVALGVAVTATVVSGAAKAAQAKSAQANAAAARKPNQPDPTKWQAKGGTIQQNSDGTTTYTRKDGVSVTYDKDGFPDFRPYRHPTVKDVQIEFTGSYDKDFALADKAAGITKKMRQQEKYTWHHHQDGKTMQLIKRDVHKDFFHTGGMSGTR